MVEGISQSSKTCLFEMLLERARQESVDQCAALSFMRLLSQLSLATAPALLVWRLAFLLLLWLLFVLPLFLLLLLCRYFFQFQNGCKNKILVFFFSFIFSTVCSARRRSCCPSSLAVRLPSLTERLQSISR